MTKAAVFDLDGVLLDSMGIWNDLGARYLRSLGVTPEEGLHKSNAGEKKKTIFLFASHI